jgi:hypothetical protein
VHLLTVWQGHWRCYHSTHKDNSEGNQCACMGTVLARLGITQRDIKARLKELQEEEEERRELAQGQQQHRRRRRIMLKLQQPYSSKPRMYRHAREPGLQQYYIPEDLRQLLQEQGLVQQLEAALRKPEPDAICAALEALLAEATCGKHAGAQGRLQLWWGQTRISHVGDKQVQLAHLAMVNCCCTDGRCIFVYDGEEDGMLHLCNTELFSHYFLADLLDELHISGNSFNTMRERMLSREQRCTDDQPRHIISLPCLIRAFSGYVQLLTDLPVACCSVCGRDVAIRAHRRWHELAGVKLSEAVAASVASSAASSAAWGAPASWPASRPPAPCCTTAAALSTLTTPGAARWAPPPCRGVTRCWEPSAGPATAAAPAGRPCAGRCLPRCPAGEAAAWHPSASGCAWQL